MGTKIRAIRDLFTKGIFIYNLQRDGFEWDMAVASMDMIGDTQLAIDAFDNE